MKFFKPSKIRLIREFVCSNSNRFNEIDTLGKNITNYFSGAGGGGATIMFINSLPVIIAGGGGGAFPTNFFNNTSTNIQ